MEKCPIRWCSNMYGQGYVISRYQAKIKKKTRTHTKHTCVPSFGMGWMKQPNKMYFIWIRRKSNLWRNLMWDGRAHKCESWRIPKKGYYYVCVPKERVSDCFLAVVNGRVVSSVRIRHKFHYFLRTIKSLMRFHNLFTSFASALCSSSTTHTMPCTVFRIRIEFETLFPRLHFSVNRPLLFKSF